MTHGTTHRAGVLVAGLLLALAPLGEAAAWDPGVGVGRPGGGAGLGGVGGPAAVGPPGYHVPPAAVVRPVPVYPAYARPVAPVARAATVGAVAGATAGAAAQAQAQARAPAPVVLTVGTTLAVLPAGCGTAQVGATTYYRCGEAWLRPSMQGTSVVYLVVAPP
jgi:hypothetical protein